MIDLNDILMEKSTGEDEITSWSGVPISTLLEQAGAGDFSSVTAIAADGYAIEISREELEGGIVALKDDGEWIAKVAPDDGPIRLVTPQTPANRWVFQLVELQIH
ncbi:MAG: molybdopterin-dependent oxidoreductase, partial [Chloroflexi bacterium]|nr:molybdopterin-dependent oxidoreductase [Chloroflexota bacterium]